MCGIGGWLGPGGPEVALKLVASLSAMDHRGPDGRGLWIDPHQEAGLGQGRLAIHDLTSNGLPPFVSPDQDWVLIANGTLHNSLALRQDPACRGYGFRSGSDLEVLLPLWQAYGDAVLPRLRGPLALAILDRRGPTLWLARDPLGKKPLFHAWDGQRVVFASELSGLFPLLGSGPELSPPDTLMFLRTGYVTAPRTVLSGVGQVEPGHVMKWDRGRSSVTRYWAPTPAAADAAPPFEHLLTEAVVARTRADRPVGVFLSGGLDSAAVLALARDALGPVPAVSLGFPERAFDERPRARLTANALGCPFVSAELTSDDAFPILEQLIRRCGEPMGDSSVLATARLCQVARSHGVVFLSGDGSDELLLGYRRYRIARWAARLNAWGLSGRGSGIILGNPGRARSRVAQARRALRAGLVGSVADLSGHGPWHDFAPWLHPELRRAADPLRTLLAQFPETGRDGAAAAALWDLQTYLPGDLLPKMDRAAMSAGVEVWSPFLDPDVVGAALAIPPRERARFGMGKRPIRRLLRGRVPRAVLRGKKKGFGIPLLPWLQRGRFGEAAQDWLREGSAPLQQVFRPGAVNEMWSLVRQGDPTAAPVLFAALSLVVFFEQHVRGKPSGGIGQH